MVGSTIIHYNVAIVEDFFNRFTNLNLVAFRVPIICLAHGTRSLELFLERVDVNLGVTTQNFPSPVNDLQSYV